MLGAFFFRGELNAVAIKVLEAFFIFYFSYATLF
jgi:hypothetical protein